MNAATTQTNGAPLTEAPACPKCEGRMWDNRTSKRNPKAPDFKCRDRSCDGALWPGQHRAAEPITRARLTIENGGDATGASEQSSVETNQRKRLRDLYLDVTRFVLCDVRPLYEDAGIPCTDSTAAAIAATAFIAASRNGGAGGAQ